MRMKEAAANKMATRTLTAGKQRVAARAGQRLRGSGQSWLFGSDCKTICSGPKVAVPPCMLRVATGEKVKTRFRSLIFPRVQASNFLNHVSDNAQRYILASCLRRYAHYISKYSVRQAL
jgi:hypothetical protein